MTVFVLPVRRHDGVVNKKQKKKKKRKDSLPTDSIDEELEKPVLAVARLQHERQRVTSKTHQATTGADEIL
jgi:hypothetical protein